MSCGPALSSFGDLDRYWGMLPSVDDVYVLRFWLINTYVDLTTPYDPLRLVSVLGHLLPAGYQVRGVAIREDPLDEANEELRKLGDEMPAQHSVHVDLILTHEHGLQVVGHFRDGSDFTELMNRTDSEFHAEWPNGYVPVDAKWYELTSPDQVVQNWRLSPVIWDYRLSSIGGQGGPTSAFVAGEGVWIGDAESPQRQLPPTEVKPIPAPPHGPGGTAPPSPAGARPDVRFWALVGAAGIATYFMFRAKTAQGVKL